jgi:hypothetical protein
VQKKSEAEKLTLALAVGLGEVPVLPQKLLKELLPGVQGALSKQKVPVRLCRRFVSSKFRAKNCVLNPKLGDWLCQFFVSTKVSH